MWALLALIALVAAACGGLSDGDETATGSEPTAVEAEATEAAGPTAEPAELATAAPTSEPAPEPTVAPTAEPEPEPETSEGCDFSAVASEIDTFIAERGLNGAGLIVVHKDDGAITKLWSAHPRADELSHC